jgi:hypothetical protein
MEALKAGDENVEYRVVDLTLVVDTGDGYHSFPVKYFEVRRDAEEWVQTSTSSWAYAVSKVPVKALRVSDGDGAVRFYAIGDDITHRCHDLQEDLRLRKEAVLQKLTADERKLLGL